MRKGANLYYFVNDHLGGTSLVMDVSGNVVSRTRYYPYGQGWTQDAGTSPPTDRLFTGQRQYGPKSGIYYYGSRFYSADIGRFLQADTVVPGAGNPQALNRYSYTLNNPVNHTDPTGHCVPDVNCPGDECYRNPACGQPAGPPGGSGGGGGGSGGSGGGHGGGGGAGAEPSSAGEELLVELLSNASDNLYANGAQFGADLSWWYCVAPEGLGGCDQFGGSAIVLALLGFTQLGITGYLEGLEAELTRLPIQAAEREAASAGGRCCTPVLWDRPPNNGFKGDPVETTLEAGTRFDRYGSETGRFAAPPGTPYGWRSLPPGGEFRTLHSYEVVQPLTVNAGEALPWYGMTGGGTQYQLPKRVSELIEEGIIRRAP